MKAEPYLTKMDIVKTEHDLIGAHIERVNNAMADGVPIETEYVVRYIDGIRTMAEALMDALQEYDEQGIGLPEDDP